MKQTTPEDTLLARYFTPESEVAGQVNALKSFGRAFDTAQSMRFMNAEGYEGTMAFVEISYAMGNEYFVWDLKDQVKKISPADLPERSYYLDTGSFYKRPSISGMPERSYMLVLAESNHEVTTITFECTADQLDEKIDLILEEMQAECQWRIQNVLRQSSTITARYEDFGYELNHR